MLLKVFMLTVVTLFVFIMFTLTSFAGKDDLDDVDSFSKYGYNTHQIVGIDKTGRTFDTIVGTKSNKYVGIFYSLWLGGHPSHMRGIYDITNLLDSNPDALWNMQGTADSPLHQYHFWGEPLFGYYNSNDDWVIRRHIEMLTIAGVDFLFFDVTNGFTYDSTWKKIMVILNEYQQQGWDVPKVSFYTHYNSPTNTSAGIVKYLYNVLYSINYYPNLWFKPDGIRPLIIGDKNGQDNRGNYLSDEIKEFFYWRDYQWPTRARNPNGFPWIEWLRPQPLYQSSDGLSVMNVSVCQHPNLPVSDSVLRGVLNWGRGFTSETGINDPDKIDKGGNFQEQWDHALTQNPDIISVTTWNEWVAHKQIYGIPYDRIIFVDQFNKEYSKDIEPMKGGYEDSFYLQLIKNIRSYKGIPGTPSTSLNISIDIKGPLSQWERVTNVYRDIGTTNYGRDYYDFAHEGTYKQSSARNNIQEVRVTNDNDNIYFMIRTEDDITPYDGLGTWMNIYIGTNDLSRQGWEGYSYIINRSPENNGKTSIEMLDSLYQSTLVGYAEYVVTNNIMQVKIPRNLLELTEKSFNIYFKVSDNIENPSDINDYYVSGKSVPMGRLSFNYKYVDEDAGSSNSK